MGAAEMVPGVSAATIAFVTGIYDRLATGLGQLTPRLFLVARKRGIRAAWVTLDGSFLAVVFSGMAIAVLTLGGSIAWLLAHHPVLTASFFGGLVVAAVWLVYRRLSRFGLDLSIGAAAGAATGGLMTLMAPINLTATPLHLFAGGVLAMCAWLLPGLSGSTLLLLVGLYGTSVTALHHFDAGELVWLVAGLWCGMVFLSQLFARLLQRHRDETLAVLAGLMAGALMRLWPWRSMASYQLNQNGVQFPVVQQPVSPDIYTSLTGQDPRVALAITAAVAGFAVAVIVARLFSESRKDPVQ